MSDNNRLTTAITVLPNIKAKNTFIMLAALFPECSIFWTDDSAILESDEIKIEVS